MPATQHADPLVEEIAEGAFETDQFVALKAVALAWLEFSKGMMEVERRWLVLDAGKVEEKVSTRAFLAEIVILASLAASRTSCALRLRRIG